MAACRGRTADRREQIAPKASCRAETSAERGAECCSGCRTRGRTEEATAPRGRGTNGATARGAQRVNGEGDISA